MEKYLWEMWTTRRRSKLLINQSMNEPTRGAGIGNAAQRY